MNDVPPRVELPPRPEFFDHYTYAKRSHWSYFEGLDKAVYGQKKKPDKVQLKVYQSLLLLRFIQEMIPAGARILYVGSGLPRILTYLAKVHECWNIDKSDPGNVSPPGKAPPYRLVCDQMGRFSRELPNDYFDLVFSIYAPQGVSQQGPEVFGNIIADIDRVLKPGGWSLHLFSVVLSPDTFQKNKFSDYIFDNVETVNKAVNPDFMKRDPDLYTISEEVYNETLLNSTKRSYQEYGRPTSSHILWQKSA